MKPQNGSGGPYLYFVNEGTEVGAKTVVGMEAGTVRLESGRWAAAGAGAVNMGEGLVDQLVCL